jgi:hypothetical protein
MQSEGLGVTYFKVTWRHDDLREMDEAAVLYHEVGADGWESRRVEAFSDGRLAVADAIDPAAPTSLSFERFPSVEEIASQADFEVEEIDEAQFEAMWRQGLAHRPAS